MKKSLFGLALALGFLMVQSGAARAQYSDDEGERVRATEFGVLAGGSLYYGDLAEQKRNYFKETTPHAGIFLRTFLSNHAAIRSNFFVGKLEGNDGWYSDPAWRKHRNFNFNTVLLEASMVFEYDLLRVRRLERGSGFDVYAFVGVGACYTDPQRNFNGMDSAYFPSNDQAIAGYLADFTKDPKHVALVIPMGLGIRERIGAHLAAFAEVGYHQGLDDRIDGFSNSVGSGKFDAYSFASLGIVMRLHNR